MVGSLGYYVTIYHMYGGDKGDTSGKLMAIVNYTIPVSTIFAVPLLQKVSVFWGKRTTMIFAFSVALVGTLVAFYTPENLSHHPLDPARCRKRCGLRIRQCDDPGGGRRGRDEDRERREGMFSAVYSWMFKIGVAMLCSWQATCSLGLFDANLDGPQSGATIFWMRICFTIIPAVALAGAIVPAFITHYGGEGL